MTEAELSALTASLPGLIENMRGEAVSLGEHYRRDGATVFLPRKSIQEAADALDRLAKALIQVITENGETNSLLLFANAERDRLVGELNEASGVDATKLANAIMLKLGITTEVSNHPGADWRRDGVVEIIDAALKRLAPATQETENG